MPEKKKLSLSDKVGYITIGSLITQFGRLVTAVIVARLVTKDIYGTYNQMFLIYGIFSPIFLSGIPGSILYFFPHLGDKKDREKFISQTISLLFSFGFIYSLVIFFSAPIVAAAFHNPELATAMRIFSLYPILNFVYSYFQPFLVASHDVKKTPVLFALTAGSNLLFMFGAAWFFPTPIGLAWSSVLCLIPPILYVLYFSREFLNKALIKVSKEEVLSQLRYAFPLGLASVIGYISYQTDRLIVSVKFNPSIYAIYAVGAFEVPVVALIGQAVNSVLVPEISRQYKENDIPAIASLWKNSLKKMSLLVFPSFVLIFVIADLIVTLLFSVKYTQSIPLFRIYLLLMPVRIASYGLILRSIGKTKIDLLASVYYLVINSILGIVLVNLIGLWGPAISTVTTTTLLAVFYLVMVRKNLEIKILDLIPLKVLGRIMVISAIPGLIVYLLRLFIRIKLNIFVGISFYSLIYIGVYALILYYSNSLTQNEKAIFLKWTGINKLKAVVRRPNA